MGLADCWLVRTDSSGGLMWNKVFGGTLNDQCNAVGVTPDGGFVLAGLSNSSDLPGGQQTAGSNDIWLLRTDVSGNLLWSQTYGGKGLEQANGISVLGDGSLVLVGQTNPNNLPSDLPGGQQSAGGWDLWLLRIDNSGNLLWNRTFGGTKYDYGRAVAVGADGSLTFAGFAQSTDMPNGVKSLGVDDFVLMRTDSSGSLSCAASGTCVKKVLSDCADTNPCTADLCDAAHNGCYHTNLPDTSPCGTGKTCKTGVCQ